MNKHLRGNLLLLAFSLGFVCVLYPAALLLFGKLFPYQAGGSTITEKGNLTPSPFPGKEGEPTVVRGSVLIAQNFTKDWYFQPRPSAVGYNATASGGSNYGASNPKLRDRVARQLGPMVKYDPASPLRSQSVQKDIESWFVGYQPAEGEPALVVQWAKSYPTLSSSWLKSDDNKPAAIEWLRSHPAILEAWKQENPSAPAVNLDDDKTIPFDDVSTAFFEIVAASEGFKNRWLESEEYATGEKDANGEAIKGKRFKPVSEGKDLQATFFDLWLQAHPDAILQKVPTDMVMASGSGLDPHITLRNALYQLDRVVEERSKLTQVPVGALRTKIEAVLKRHTFTPLSGMIGEPLVNVLEVNRDLDAECR